MLDRITIKRTRINHACEKVRCSGYNRGAVSPTQNRQTQSTTLSASQPQALRSGERTIMKHTTRALWQLLLIITDPTNDDRLTCMECFAILEYLAELAAAGGDLTKLRTQASRSLRHCPDCQPQYTHYLLELEMQYVCSTSVAHNRRTTSDPSSEQCCRHCSVGCSPKSCMRPMCKQR